MRACVIGAGPSGLVAAKYLLQDPDVSEVIILESSGCIGGTFVNKVYDDTGLVSSSTLTAFSDYRFSNLKSRHVSASEYVEYLLDYAHHFKILECIHFNSTVTNICEAENEPNKYTVSINKLGHDYHEVFDAIAVCSGLHNIPIVPTASEIPNLDAFKGRILHSSEYKRRDIFRGKRVLVVGCGETAMDIAYRATQSVGSKGSVGMVVRHGFLSIPHYMGSPDKPLDVFITNVFEHAFEHPYVQRLQLRWGISTYVIRFFLLLLGSSWGFNQWVFPVKDVKRGYHIINKSHAAMAHLNAHVKRRYGFLGRLSMWLYGETDLKPIVPFGGGGIGIKSIVSVTPSDSRSKQEDNLTTSTMGRSGSNGDDGSMSIVEFENGEQYPCDLIVFCTGYRQSFPFLDPHLHSTAVVSTAPRVLSSSENTPQPPDSSSSSVSSGTVQEHSPAPSYRHAAGEDTLPPVHFISDGDRHKRIGFIGFVRPNVGAIPPMSELQVMWWLQSIKGNVHAPGLCGRKDGRPSYSLLGNKYQYGVDYGNYMHRVAEEIGAAPSLFALWRNGGIRALYAYCQGQAHVPLFRLVGPYASHECWNTVVGELYDVCTDRGVVENAGLLLMNVGFLGINLSAYLMEAMYCYSFGWIFGSKFQGFAKYR